MDDAPLSPNSRSRCNLAERAVQRDYRQHFGGVNISRDEAPRYVRYPFDRSVVVDHHARPLTVDRVLATKPLQHELSQRPGPGNKTLTYLSGDGVTRALNDIFGYDGWNLTILSTTQQHCQQIQNSKWHVAYMAQVRITLAHGVCFREDVGCGDAMDRSVVTASANALKASITDGMKRAARHFGDKLGNSLYSEHFNHKNAPKTLSEALDLHDQERAHYKFGAITSTTSMDDTQKLASRLEQNIPAITSPSMESNDGTQAQRLPAVANTNIASKTQSLLPQPLLETTLHNMPPPTAGSTFLASSMERPCTKHKRVSESSLSSAAKKPNNPYL